MNGHWQQDTLSQCSWSDEGSALDISRLADMLVLSLSNGVLVLSCLGNKRIALQ